ncbi:MAG: S1 RNA-binding domain-containing protein [Firmicutes bacterium]|nr:S1 RNA-binding domain-containing protein [Bacillota bacterium]
MSSLQIGQVVTGKVTGITNFGAFVALPNGATGLVHISEVADSYVKDINDYLQPNQEVNVKILSIANGKIGLSIRRAKSDQERTKKSFEDKLAKFFKESDELHVDLRRKVDSKRGGRGGRR